MAMKQLPAKWAVLKNVTVGEWLNKESVNLYKEYHILGNSYSPYFIYPMISFSHYSRVMPDGYTLITEQQFNEVMETKTDKNIIGYNLIKPELEALIRKALGYTGKYSPFFIRGHVAGWYIKECERLGIMNYFEPVYEEVKPPLFTTIEDIGNWAAINNGDADADRAYQYRRLLNIVDYCNKTFDSDNLKHIITYPSTGNFCVESYEQRIVTIGYMYYFTSKAGATHALTYFKETFEKLYKI